MSSSGNDYEVVKGAKSSGTARAQQKQSMSVSPIDKSTDFISIMTDLASKLNLKIAIFVFILGFIILSDVFRDKILAGFDAEIHKSGVISTRGTITQLMFLTFGYIIVDLLATYQIV
jgi:hypothetical protein